MRKATKAVVSIVLILTTFLALAFTYAENQSQPPEIKTVSWNTAQENIQKYNPLEYVNITVNGKPITMAVQLIMATGNVTADIPFLEIINVQFISNSSVVSFHTRAYITYASINGSVIISKAEMNGYEYVGNGELYQMTYGPVAAQQNVVLPAQESANITVLICDSYGPYWQIVNSYHLHF